MMIIMGYSAYTFPLLAIFLITTILQTWPATSNFLSPMLSPIFDDVCKAVECGKGSCKPSTNSNSTFPFFCQCNPGWTQTLSRHGQDQQGHFSFLPCVVPNCTLDLSCTKGSLPVQEKEKQAKESIFDPCHWADCGGGTCNKTSLFTHKCECLQGYTNLFNTTAFPCFSECALGMDCSSFGITMTNKSNSSQKPSLADSGTSLASSITRACFSCLIMTLISLAVMVLWK